MWQMILYGGTKYSKKLDVLDARLALRRAHELRREAIEEEADERREREAVEASTNSLFIT